MNRLKGTSLTLSVDAVTASVEATTQELCDTLAAILGGSLHPTRAPHGYGYSHAAEIVHPDTMARRVLVMHGKAHSKPCVFAEGTHEYDAPALYDALTTHYAGCWKPSRIDVALDLDHPEAFDIINGELVAFALERNIKLDQRGDWDRGHGRTRYLYSRVGNFFVRLYEYLDHHGHGPACRLELELKLKSKHRERLARMAPWEMLALCPATQHVVASLGLDLKPLPLSQGQRKPQSIERDLAFLASTPFPALMRLVAHHQGDYVTAFAALLDYRAETERTRALLAGAAPCDTSPPMQHHVSPVGNW